MKRGDRENLVLRDGERWQPPAYRPPTTRAARVLSAVRRFFDLQAASVWTDLRAELANADGTVVDVGCGAQPYRGLLGAAATYVGIDTPDAAEDFGYALPDVRRLGADGRWPVDDGEVDLVLATETLEHVADPRAFLAEARRATHPGSRLVLTVPFAARWHYIPHDYWRYTPSSLRMLLEEAGFAEIVVTARGDQRTVAAYKVLALLLARAMPQDETGSARPSLVWAPLVALPAALLAAIGHRSLRGPGGDDCLGYTVTAVRRG